MAGKKKDTEAMAEKLGFTLKREESGSLVLAPPDPGTGYRFGNEQDARNFLAEEAMRQRQG